MARNRYDMDEVLEDSFDISQLKRLAAYVSPYKEKMAGIILLMLTSSALTMMIPIFFQRIMDIYIPEKNMEKIVFVSILTLAVACYSAIAMRFKIKTMSIIGQSIIHSIRTDIFHHLQELPFSYYDDKPHGKIQVRVVNYVNSLSDLLSNGIVNTVTDLCNLFFIIIFMFFCDPRLTLICLCGLPLLAVVIVFIKKKQRKAWQVQSNKQSNLNAYIAESINGIRVTQSFVRENENNQIFNTLSANYRRAWMHAIKFNFTMGPSVDICHHYLFYLCAGHPVDSCAGRHAHSGSTDCVYRLYRTFLGAHQHPGRLLQFPADRNLLPGADLRDHRRAGSGEGCGGGGHYASRER